MTTVNTRSGVSIRISLMRAGPPALLELVGPVEFRAGRSEGSRWFSTLRNFDDFRGYIPGQPWQLVCIGGCNRWARERICARWPDGCKAAGCHAAFETESNIDFEFQSHLKSGRPSRPSVGAQAHRCARVWREAS